MRKCKQSDIQALDAIGAEIGEISIHLAMLNGRLKKLQNDIEHFQLHGEEYTDVQITPGSTADNQRN